MTERTKAKSFGGSPEQRARKEAQEKIASHLNRFETEFKVYKIRRKEDPSGLVQSLQMILFDLLSAYRIMGLNPDDILDRVKVLPLREGEP